ncbi:uncharacterized protein N7483_010156 [Penicillium malachiteum]|uniref:uncharacterized protein n=1 Tax=Penicillium malachiteum TaxID=1324776 RepID=UPI002548588D|nr:uncharacterized protein N7483_010156 [Penicillium malachiteum]KAJ5712975.1 hypothetical protein N7483_010156 [Penicillium malachiteum]
MDTNGCAEYAVATFALFARGASSSSGAVPTGIHANIFGPMEEEPFSRDSLREHNKARYLNNWQAESDDAHAEAAILFLGK